MLIGIIMYIIAMILPSKTVFKIGSWIQWIIIAINLLLLFNPDLFSESGYWQTILVYLISVGIFAIFTAIAYLVTYRRQDKIETENYIAQKNAREKRERMWICKRCGALNEETLEKCLRCNTDKETTD